MMPESLKLPIGDSMAHFEYRFLHSCYVVVAVTHKGGKLESAHSVGKNPVLLKKCWAALREWRAKQKKD